MTFCLRGPQFIYLSQFLQSSPTKQASGLHCYQHDSESFWRPYSPQRCSSDIPSWPIHKLKVFWPSKHLNIWTHHPSAPGSHMYSGYPHKAVLPCRRHLSNRWTPLALVIKIQIYYDGIALSLSTGQRKWHQKTLHSILPRPLYENQYIFSKMALLSYQHRYLPSRKGCATYLQAAGCSQECLTRQILYAGLGNFSRVLN